MMPTVMELSRRMTAMRSDALIDDGPFGIYRRMRKYFVQSNFILYAGYIIGDGVYWREPDGNGAFEAYCDIVTDGERMDFGGYHLRWR